MNTCLLRAFKNIGNDGCCVTIIGALALMVAACAPIPQKTERSESAVVAAAAKVPDKVRQELSADLAALQDQTRVKRISKSLTGPLAGYREFATATRGGAVLSSPADRASIVTTIYPGSILGLSGKEVGQYTEVGYEYSGSLLTGWVRADVVGLQTGFAPTALTAAEKQALYRKLLDAVNALRAKWADNPYISIGGFSINVERAPSVSVEINYK